MLCAGKCTQVQVLPDSNTAGQSHMACKLLHSTKQAAFVLFYRVLEGGGKGALLTPGALEWTLVPEIKMGEEKSMVWTLPGSCTGTLQSHIMHVGAQNLVRTYLVGTWHRLVRQHSSFGAL